MHALYIFLQRCLDLGSSRRSTPVAQMAVMVLQLPVLRDRRCVRPIVALTRSRERSGGIAGGGRGGPLRGGGRQVRGQRARGRVRGAAVPGRGVDRERGANRGRGGGGRGERGRGERGRGGEHGRGRGPGRPRGVRARGGRGQGRGRGRGQGRGRGRGGIVDDGDQNGGLPSEDGETRSPRASLTLAACRW